MSSVEGINIEGDCVTLRSKGIGRYFEAVFLAVWLAFWAVGLGVALVVLGSMLTALFGFMRQNEFAAFGRRILERGPGYETGFVFLYVFLIVWVTFWTLGGCAAMYRLLRLVAGRDRVRVSGSALELAWRAGPVGGTRHIERGELRRVRVRPHDKALVADTLSKTMTITDLGSVAERESLCAWLRSQLALGATSPPVFDPLVPPPGWRVMRGEAGVLHLSRPVRGRRITGAVMAAITAVGVYGWAIDVANHGLASPVPAVMIALFAAASAWVGLAHQQWLAGPGRLHYQLQFGPLVRERSFSSGHLEVVRTTDSDGDAHYKLLVRDESRKRTIATSNFDDAELMDCARWLESATGFRLMT